jgi:hypothetical protein
MLARHYLQKVIELFYNWDAFKFQQVSIKINDFGGANFC